MAISQKKQIICAISSQILQLRKVWRGFKLEATELLSDYQNHTPH